MDIKFSLGLQENLMLIQLIHRVFIGYTDAN